MFLPWNHYLAHNSGVHQPIHRNSELSISWNSHVSCAQQCIHTLLDPGSWISLPMLCFMFYLQFQQGMIIVLVLTFQATNTFSWELSHMEWRGHLHKMKLAFPTLINLDIQKQPLLMHRLSPQAIQSAWELPSHRPKPNIKQKWETINYVRITH